jgi:predicted  nucleic acid-binding Zn-ribbon protein
MGTEITKYGDMSPRQNAHYRYLHPVTEPEEGNIIEPVNQIAKSIDAEITRQVDAKVKSILEEGGKDEWIAWFQNEVEQWKQRAEELEIELECMKNAFPEHENEILPKHRGIFNNENQV